MSDYYGELPLVLGELSPEVRGVVSDAVQNAQRDQAVLTTGHMLLSIITVEWGWFSYVARDLNLDPESLREDVKGHVAQKHRKVSPSGWLSKGEYVSAQAKDVLQMAKKLGTKIGGRTQVELPDLFWAIFDEQYGIASELLGKRDLDQEEFRSRLMRLLFNSEVINEKMQKNYDLPPNLKIFGTNLNLLAIRDKTPPLYGREEELAQVIEVLCHRERSNSVMLIGEPGVGKTAIVEGLARKIEFEPSTLPHRLRGCQIISLQMNNIVAGTSLRGMFEDRMKFIIQEVKNNPHFILFVDEAHTLVGAGSALGAPSDAANMLKSVLARGEIRVIGATTLGEYKEYVKEDEALDRRFRTVQIEEPSIEETRRMLYNLRPRLERNYSVSIRDEAIETALELSPQYVRHLRLPDKVIGWLDTAAVKAEMAGERTVGARGVIKVISKIARIPEDMVARDVTDKFESIEAKMGARVIGQSEAVRAVANCLRLNKSPLKDNFSRPDGVLLFLGPTGVGKTELAKALAEFLFGDEKKMLRLDMSEYQEGSASVDKLIGSARGVVGSERGGILTNQLRDNPYSVLLLDEIEKASLNVLNLFLQAFSEGWITDGRGKKVYLSDAIVIMTSNIGAQHFRKLTNPLGFRAGDFDLAQVKADVVKEAELKFNPEFFNRIDEVVVFNPLSEGETVQIAEKMLEEIGARMAEKGKFLNIGPLVKEVLARQGYSLKYGARFLKRKIEKVIKMPIISGWKSASRFKVSSEGDEIVVSPNGKDKTEDDTIPT